MKTDTSLRCIKLRGKLYDARGGVVIIQDDGGAVDINETLRRSGLVELNIEVVIRELNEEN